MMFSCGLTKRPSRTQTYAPTYIQLPVVLLTRVGENKAAKKGWMEAERAEAAEQHRKFEDHIFAKQPGNDADIMQLDDYIESLYEDDHVSLPPCL